ncbi:invasion associated locus B family protein [Gymnodinialimonas sp. 57CJ19]|uniref:invasion associated locus B family protein n=1 Tax=Gymnodinialimonas sp. 57CJ19 TaxID=3138498 RepID=UPI0031344EC8
MKTGLSGVTVLALGLCTAMPGFAQTADAPWPVYVQEDPARCWVVSPPTGTTASRNGTDVSGNISRDTVLMFVSYWPEDGRLGEISYTGGYQFAVGSDVTVVVGDQTFALFTEGPMAWAGSPEDDARIIAAMRDGTEAVLTATSTRGTEVVDTFDLQGFSRAMDDASVRCAPSN